MKNRMVVRPAMMYGLETPTRGRAKDAKILFRDDKDGQNQEQGH